MFRFGGLTAGIWWLLLMHAFIAVRLLRQRRLPPGAVNRPIDSDWLAVTLCGIIPCSLWYIAMPEHAFIHEHFLYRHLFFCFFLGVLFSATYASVKAWETAPRHGKAQVIPASGSSPG